MSNGLLYGQMRQAQAAQQQGQQDFMQKILASVIDQEIKRKYAAPLTKMIGDELFQYDWDTKKWKTTGVKKPREAATAKDILGITAGVTPPERVFPREEIEEVSPLSVAAPQTRERETERLLGRGQVLTPPGARFRPPGVGERRGEILGPQGKRIGEFLKGYEPRKAPEAFPAVLGQRFGVTKEEAERKYLGLPKRKEVGKERELTTSEKKAIGRIQSSLTLIKEGTAEDIGQVTIGHFIASIQKAGFDPSDPIFEDVLEEARNILEERKPKSFLERFRR